MKEIQDIYELSLLYDFYGILLKEQKKEIFEDYILNDLSLGEIAQERGISRQGVHDSIKRCSRELFEYEEKLRLIQKFNHIREMLKEIRQTTCLLEKCGEVPETKKILKLLDDIMEEL